MTERLRALMGLTAGCLLASSPVVRAADISVVAGIGLILPRQSLKRRPATGSCWRVERTPVGSSSRSL